jgi:preprotein translocase subunit SecE
MAKTAAIEQSGSEQKLQGLKASTERLTEFFGQVRTEMRKVSTPNREQVVSTTFVVLITVFAFAFYFWAVDAFFRFTIDRMLQYFTR